MPVKRNMILVLLLICVFSAPGPVCAEKIEKIVAIVNGDIITDEELSMFIRMEFAGEEKGADQKKVVEFRKDLLNRMIEDRLILQEAKRQQLKVDDSMVEDRIREIKFRAGSELAFEMALKSQGISINELREKLKNQLMIYSLVQKEVKEKVVVSPKEITDYFQQHEAQFLTPETVVVDSIFAKDKDALAKAQAELSAGADFSEVAKKYSEKSNLGEVRRGQFKKELEDFIFSLGVGQCSRPFKTEDGYYIFIVKEKLTPSKKSIEDVKDGIKAYLENEKSEKILREWIEGLKEKAYISIRE
ncbi:MAG: peptidyl-prolyl cis-trans isomerase [Candidatus Omnitrophota bacterium]